MKVVVVPKGLSDGILEGQVLKPWGKGEDVVFFNAGDYGGLNKYDVDVISVFDVIKKRKKVDLIYFRDFHSFFKLFFLRLILSQASFVYDFRGLAHYESFMRNRSKFRYFVLKKIEHACYKWADEVRVVSKNMQDYLADSYGEKEHVTVIPCCVSADELIEQPLRGTDSEGTKFVYVGSLSRWQCFEDALELYSSVPDPKSLAVFTPNVPEAKQIIERLGIVAEVKKVTRSEVLSRLPDYDFGFVLREDDLVNKVASPVKFIEYCSRGVVPITTIHAGDYGVDFANICYVLDEGEKSLNSKRFGLLLGKPNRRKLIERCKSYTWESYSKYFG